VRFLRRFLRGAPEPVDNEARAAEGHAAVAMCWRGDASVPIADWHALSQHPDASDASTCDAYWTSAALQWLDAMRSHFDAGYPVARSAHFALFSAMDARESRLTLDVCERMRRRVLQALPGVAEDRGHGPHVALVFESIDDYYAYVGNYYATAGDYAMSSGMFIQHGYGHFVFVRSEIDAMEPVIAHELTHSLVAHLPIPAWLNEGVAVSTEKALLPHLADPRMALWTPRELEAKHAAFWNAQTIQEFWIGKSFLRPDEGNALSYDLGERLVRLLARDYATFATFMNAAGMDDAGLAAARDVLAVDLGDAVAAILGEGTWRPQPQSWSDGLERGQFRQPGNETGATMASRQ